MSERYDDSSGPRYVIVGLAAGGLLAIAALFGIFMLTALAPKQNVEPGLNNPASSEQPDSAVVKKFVISSHKLQYPLNENNQQIILGGKIGEKVTTLGFEPISAHFAEVRGASEDCRQYRVGALRVGSPEQLGTSQSELDNKAGSGLARKLNDKIYIELRPFEPPLCELQGPNQGAIVDQLMRDAQLTMKNWFESVTLR